MSYEKWPYITLIFIILANSSTFSAAQSTACIDNGVNHTSNSLYDSILNNLLVTLAPNLDNNGFYRASMGQSPNKANAIVLCRGDSQLDACRTCVEGAITELVKSCANHKQGVIWYDLCMLRYSNESIFGFYAANSIIVTVWNTANVSNPDSFEADLRALLDDLRGEAANGGGVRKVAAGNRSTVNFQTIFGMVQCTPDLPSQDCTNCLLMNAGSLPQCCKRAARVFSASCDIRYDILSLYNETRLEEIQIRPPPPPTPPPPPSPPPPPPPPPSLEKKDDNKTRAVILIVVSISACLFLLVCVGVLLRKKRKPKAKPKSKPKGDVDDSSTAESLHFDFDKIRQATDDFSDSNKLGEGGFGAVYKGKLQNGEKIAVKRLSKGSRQGALEFRNEVLLLARLQHRNLVRLLGFSMEGDERLLVYAFVENASLDNFLFDRVKRSRLDWEVRCKIIGGIARGLLYLHEDSRIRIIHRDLKASNVLLDEHMNAKIADFGIAKLFMPDETQGRTNRIVGTYGYMAPEYARHGHFSVKSDVFSFGVIVLEIINGEKNSQFRNQDSAENLVSHAWKYWSRGAAVNLIDPTLRSGSGLRLNDILRYIHIGLLCVQENAMDRPTMASVVLMLGSFTMTLPLALRPAFFVPGNECDSEAAPRRAHNSIEDESTKSSNNSARHVHSSVNEMTITDICGR